MTLHVINQPNTWENLATSFLFPLLTGMIQRNIQAGDNRLKNRALVEAFPQNNTLSNMNNAVTDNAWNNLAIQQDNSNAWANAFHGNAVNNWDNISRSNGNAWDNAFKRSEINQNGNLLNIMSNAVNQPDQVNNSTAVNENNMLSNLYNVLASNRQYAGLNPQEMAQLAQPLINERQKAYDRQRAIESASKLASASGNNEDYNNNLIEATMLGLLPPEMYKNIMASRNPIISGYDLGNNYLQTITNPMTGTQTFNRFDKGVNPDVQTNADVTMRGQTLNYADQAQKNSINNYIAQTNAHDYSTFKDNDGYVYTFDKKTGQAITLKKPNGMLIEAPGEIGNLKIDSNGNYILVGTDGYARPLRDLDTGEIVKSQQSSSEQIKQAEIANRKDYNDARLKQNADKERNINIRAQLTSENKKLEELSKTRQELVQRAAIFEGDPAGNIYADEIKKIDTQILNSENTIRQLTNQLNNSNGDTILEQMNNVVSGGKAIIQQPKNIQEMPTLQSMDKAVSGDDVTLEQPKQDLQISQRRKGSHDLFIYDDMRYNEQRDSGLPREKIILQDDLQNDLSKKISELLNDPKYQRKTPQDAIDILRKHGYKIK